MDRAAQARKRRFGGFAGSAPFQLGDVDVVPKTGTINGPNGTRHLDPKVMLVLLRLVAAGADVVSRDSLMADVWPDTVVSDFALSRCVYQLRKNLSRVTASSESPIETLPKRGYRLAWNVSKAPSMKVRPLRPGRLGIGFLLAVLVVLGIAVTGWVRTVSPTPAKRMAVAVLPFQDLTEAGNLEYFGDGVATALMSELGRITVIDVIARTSSFHFRNRDASVSEIAASLDVDYLVEGSVNKDGEAVRVTVALVDTVNGRQVWTGTFDGVIGQPFTAEQDIADAVAGHLEISLGDPRSHGGTTVFEAYDAFLKAFDTVNLVRDDGSNDLFLDKALAYDPDFAQAFEGKAFLIYLRLWQGQGSVEEAWNEARPLLERAIELNERSSFAYGTLAGFQIFRNDYRSAETNLKHALEINPSDTWALVHLSRLMEHTGHLEESVRLARHNVRLDPLNPFRHLQLANRLWTSELFDEAESSFERALELDPLNYATWSDWCTRLANRDGELAAFQLLAKFQENPEFREQFLGSRPQLAPRGIGLIARLLGQIGDYDRERRLLQLLSELSDGAGLHEELAWMFLAEGDLEKAETEAQLALAGTPQADMTNVLMAAVALKRGIHLEDALDHFRSRWPGLFLSPPVTDAASDLVVASSALILVALGETEQGGALLETLAANEDSSPMARAIALANRGRIEAALTQLETHVTEQNSFDTFPGDPFWEPLAKEPRFQAIIAAEDLKDARARDQLEQMIERGDLVMPMAVR